MKVTPVLDSFVLTIETGGCMACQRAGLEGGGSDQEEG